MEDRNIFFYVFVLVLLIVGGTIYYLEYTKEPFYVKEYEDKIQALHAKIDSLHSENESLGVEVDSLVGLIADLDIEIYQLDEIIRILREERDENIDNIDNLSTNELTEFFTNRYRFIISNTSRTDSTSSN